MRNDIGTTISSDYRGVALFALLVMAWPVLEMSWPAPAVVWQAPRSGATLRNPSRIRVERVIFLHMKITLLSGSKTHHVQSSRVQIWPLHQT
jgi:hypothetical protein